MGGRVCVCSDTLGMLLLLLDGLAGRIRHELILIMDYVYVCFFVFFLFSKTLYMHICTHRCRKCVHQIVMILSTIVNIQRDERPK